MKQLTTTCLFLLFLMLSIQSKAQTDTEFWFVAPEVSSEHGDRPILLRLSTINQAARLNFSIPANPNFVPIILSLEPNSTTTLDLTPWIDQIENRPANQILQKGLFIRSSAPITAYYEVASEVNPEIFPLKGSNALGTDFVLPFQNFLPNQNGKSAADIVATEDNTLVTITPTANAVGRAANQTFTITLNRGETYSLEAVSTLPSGRMIGTIVRANKPIAVTISDDSIRFANQWDLIGDQMVPVDRIGIDYIAVRGYATPERVFVMATQNNTQVFLGENEEPTAVLDRGQMLPLVLNQPALYIRSDKPVYVYQLTGHDGELADAILPPIDCTGSGQVGFVRTNENRFDLMLLTQRGNENGFVLNGNPLNIANRFSPVPGNSEWLYTLITFAEEELRPGPHLLLNTEGFFHLGILHQLGVSSVYGYFSNYNVYAGSNQFLCPGGATVLDPGPFFSNYLWSDGSTGQTLAVTEPGQYTLTVTFDNCSATDTFDVSFAPTAIDLGDSVSICAGEAVRLNVPGFDTYEWRVDDSEQPFSFTPGVRITTSGTYNLTASNICGTFTDTLRVNVVQRPTLDVEANLLVCDEDALLLQLPPGFDTYLWDNGTAGPDLLVTEAGTYGVNVSRGPCTLRRQVQVRFGRSPSDISLGQDRIVCLEEETLLQVSASGVIERYVWSDGSEEPTLLVQGSGTHSVTVSNECGQAQATINLLPVSTEGQFVPNVFTPNGDGDNDFFILSDELIGSRMLVTNRWGQTVFQTDSYQNDWDGGQLPAGIYYYRIDSDCLQEGYNGWLKIIREN